MTDWKLTTALIVDRAAHRRELPMDHADAVIVRDGSLLAVDGRLVLVPPSARPPAALVAYLGQDAGRDLVAVVPEGAFDPEYDGIGGERLVGLRDLLRDFAERGADGARDHELAVTAVAIANWHANHPRCPSCGEPTVPALGGWMRRCDQDAKDHYPRTDPAVIVAITDADDRLLLAHAAYWSPHRFSHLAGYVEPGESFEQAVHREIFEEAGLRVHDLTYVASQPWPFPASVMVGYRARVEDPTLALDLDEITEARWVAREEVAPLVAEGSVVLAPHGSIARRLIEDWYGGPVEDAPHRGPVDV